MTKTPAMARLDVLEAASYWHFKLLMPFLLVMALGPMIAGLIAFSRDKGLRFEWWSLVICSACAWLLTLVLFVYAFDWNRWIYIHVFSSLLLMLMIEKRRQQTNPVVQESVLPGKPAARYATITLLVASILGWQLSFYHHFPLPGDKLVFYLKSKIKGTPLRQKPIWHLPPDSSS